MGQRTIIMHPTVERATQNWLQIKGKYKSLIKETTHNPLSVKFINGDIWYFRGQTEGPRAYRGYHADISWYANFSFDEKIKEIITCYAKTHLNSIYGTMVTDSIYYDTDSIKTTEKTNDC